MPRPSKRGLEYFPMDVDLFQDIKVRKLIKHQGGKAVTVYALLLCLIYKSGYYMRWDEELPFVISEQTGFDEAYIHEAIKCCMTLGLFDADLFKDYGVITSQGIQKRYQEVTKFAKRVDSIVEFSLISSEETPISSEETPISSEETPISSEFMRQKKSKVKERNKEKKLGKKEIAAACAATNSNAAIRKEDCTKNGELSTDARALKFKACLEPYAGRYPAAMIDDFFAYWSEKNRSKTKMRFELEKTFEVARRLAYWARHDETFGRSRRGLSPPPPTNDTGTDAQTLRLMQKFMQEKKKNIPI